MLTLVLSVEIDLFLLKLTVLMCTVRLFLKHMVQVVLFTMNIGDNKTFKIF